MDESTFHNIAEVIRRHNIISLNHVISMTLIVPFDFYERLGSGMLGVAVQPSEEFALYWEPSGDEFMILRRRISYDTDFTLMWDLEKLNPDISFAQFGSSDGDAKRYLYHTGKGTFEVVDPKVARKRLGW